ncbi:hypothetical protein ZIOFF_018968 [Zingiber officinale]|uniref:Deoxyuridine 5'-triphosphate nucleotidohydrolase n=1 Tax=Zingiber officinale TaxID=94328 RepID=A0A8J5LSF2_ZINOF|nr:hypothetical protein ZIOFF_018968 [Zingiber officinale]
MQFQRYTPTIEDREVQRTHHEDVEITSPENEILAMLREEYPKVLYVTKTNPDVIIPERRTAGAAGYDLTLNHSYIIEAGERELIPTDLAFAIPKGYYGCIAPRSGVAWRTRIHIGAGVIDSDFRGEVKILMFNMTYGNIILNKGEAIAQLILEKIVTPEIVQVVELPHTVRGTRGFGSTDQQTVVQTTTPAVQLGTTAWTNLMDKLLPRKKVVDPSTSYQRLYALTEDMPNDEWINPFYTEGGGYDSSTSFYSAEPDVFDEQMIAHLDLEEGLEMDYPIQKKDEGLFASSSAISKYNPPKDTMMGPPAIERLEFPNSYQNSGFIGAKIRKIKREYSEP